jgi:hypothetical protein
MMENNNQQEENKTLDFDTLLNRAESAEENKKFTIASNHYFTILSRHFTLLSQRENLMKIVTDAFVFNTILLPVGLQRDKYLNFILKNENLNVFDYKTLLERM